MKTIRCPQDAHFVHGVALPCNLSGTSFVFSTTIVSRIWAAWWSKAGMRVHLTEFERRVRRYQDRVFGFACHLLGSQDDARDVTQDVLIRLWRAGGGVDDARLLPWLMRVTRNTCIDVLRRRVARGHAASDMELEDVPHGDASPEEMAELSDDLHRVEVALSALAEPYRSVVVLREIQGLTYDEISDAMDMPLNTVKVTLHRGRRMLRNQLAATYERHRV